MTELSENARLIAGSTFGFSPGAALRYQMVQSVPSPEMQAALDELVAAGVVLREDEPTGAVRYSASREHDFTELRKFAAERMMSDDPPKIRIYIPKTDGMEQP
jgi:hypothetical protein